MHSNMDLFALFLHSDEVAGAPLPASIASHDGAGTDARPRDCVPPEWRAWAAPDTGLRVVAARRG
jgi:hypothetical protein